jgi:hypothetical protein
VDHDGNGDFVISADGSGSWDPDGSIVAYNWFLDGAWVAEGQYQDLFAPIGQHTFTLEVTDNDGLTASDDFIVTVDPGPPSQPPVAVAGEDQTWTVGEGETEFIAAIDGSGSYDPDGDIVRWDWYYDGNWVLEGQYQDIHVELGTHTIKLIVTDNDGNTASDELSITVNGP